ncbi:MAG: FmdB family zinc ribbon protein [Candidatus Saccharicenans sp.]
MPIYEYRCQDCGRQSSFLLLSINSPFEPVCRHCGSRRLVRLVSRVAVLRSEESRLERLADPSNLGELDENDPASVARWMKKFGREMGEELGPEFDQELEQAVEEAEKAKEREEAGENEVDEDYSPPEENSEPAADSMAGSGSVTDEEL